MDERWIAKRVLIVVKTYPTPAMSGVEVSCTAGITEDNKWIRLFPVPYRFLDEDRRFSRYQWINVNVTKAPRDPRPESYKLNEQTIQISGKEPPWEGRWKYVAPLKSESLCEIQRVQRANGSPTLGIFKPGKITRLSIEDGGDAWTQKQLLALNQDTMLSQSRPIDRLEKIPFDFKYVFQCADVGCKGHKLSCTDWEMGQAYRSWKRQYGAKWETHFRRRFENEMTSKFDTHFFVGTMHGHPKTWIIVGLYYPPRPSALPLFDAL
jgi:hypothetical protein